MENETVYSKLRRAESFLQQIPEDFRTLFGFKINHLESDFVGISFLPSQKNYVGVSVDNVRSISVKDGEMFPWVEMETNGSSITLYQSGSSHITLF